MKFVDLIVSFFIVFSMKQKKKKKKRVTKAGVVTIYAAERK